MTTINRDLGAALAAAAPGAPRRYVITGGPSSGKDDLIEALHAAGIPCMAEEPGREIYRKHRARLSRHLLKEDRPDYSLEVLAAFIAEYIAHTHGIRFYNRGIPDGYGWEGFFGLKPTPQLEEATKQYRYDAIFVLDPLDTFEDPDDTVWAKAREIRRVHELIVQGYYDASYEPVFVAPGSASARLDFICANLRLPKPIEPAVRAHEMGIYKRYFDLIATGRKTTEIRVNDSSRKKIKKGSLIRFHCQGDQVLTRVTSVTLYTSFEEMFDHESVESVNPTASRAEQLANIRQIYPPEREALGVIAIGIELVDPPRPA